MQNPDLSTRIDQKVDRALRRHGFINTTSASMVDALSSGLDDLGDDPEEPRLIGMVFVKALTILAAADVEVAKAAQRLIREAALP